MSLGPRSARPGIVNGKDLSNTRSLALLLMRCSPSTKGGPGSCPSKRYGWLLHLRSCEGKAHQAPCQGRAGDGDQSTRMYLHDNVEEAGALAALAVDSVHVLLQDIAVELPLHAARLHIRAGSRPAPRKEGLTDLVIGIYILISVLEGRPFSTSAFNLHKPLQNTKTIHISTRRTTFGAGKAAVSGGASR
jgi:hypothetical protein